MIRICMIWQRKWKFIFFRTSMYKSVSKSFPKYFFIITSNKHLENITWKHTLKHTAWLWMKLQLVLSFPLSYIYIYVSKYVLKYVLKYVYLLVIEGLYSSVQVWYKYMFPKNFPNIFLVFQIYLYGRINHRSRSKHTWKHTWNILVIY